MRLCLMGLPFVVSSLSFCFAQQAQTPGHADARTARSVVAGRAGAAAWAAAKGVAAGVGARAAGEAAVAAAKSPVGTAIGITFTGTATASREQDERSAPARTAPPKTEPIRSRPEHGGGGGSHERIDSSGGPAHDALVDKVSRTGVITRTHLITSQLYACSGPGSTFEKCRSLILGREPLLNMLESSEQTWASQWQKESSHEKMPDTCKRAGAEVYAAWSDYFSVEHQAIQFLKALDPNSKDSMRAFAKQFQPVIDHENAVLRRLDALPPWPKECAKF